MLSSKCCGQIVFMTQNVMTFNNNMGRVLSGIASRMYYSKDKGGTGCDNVSQTEGRRVEPWPKPDPPPQMWRCECPQDPQPPNYDPYRIKVPEVVVPPLPPGKATEIPSEDARELFRKPENNLSPDFQLNGCRVQDLFHNSPFVHPDYWKDKPVKKLTEAVKEVLPKLGYHGRNKYKYAFHEPWRPLDRMALLEEAEKQEQSDVASADDKTNKLIT